MVWIYTKINDCKLECYLSLIDNADGDKSEEWGCRIRPLITFMPIFKKENADMTTF